MDKKTSIEHGLKVQISKSEVFEMTNLITTSSLRTYQKLLFKKRMFKVLSCLQLLG